LTCHNNREGGRERGRGREGEREGGRERERERESQDTGDGGRGKRKWHSLVTHKHTQNNDRSL